MLILIHDKKYICIISGVIDENKTCTLHIWLHATQREKYSNKISVTKRVVWKYDADAYALF